MFRIRLQSILAAFLLAFSISAPAWSFDQVTRWYSLSVQPPDNTTPPLFLTNGSGGVTLERYRSGDPTQMWALTQEDYPAAARVTGGGGFGSQGCLAEAGWGCPFVGRGGETYRIVNRASGGCLLFGAGGQSAATSPCVNVDTDLAERQKWRAVAHPGGGFTPLIGLSNGNSRCLAAPLSASLAAIGHLMVSDACMAGQYSSYHRFAGQLSAEIRCTTAWAYNLCFVEGQR